MKNKREDILFVEVNEPEEVRRCVLESLKDIVESLQRFEKFKDIREDKIENINKLGQIVKETGKLVSDLKNSLPGAKIRAIKLSRHELPEKKKPAARKNTAVAEEKKEKPLTELQKLESELSEIESKLNSLR